jgi:hypothetical protein
VRKKIYLYTSILQSHSKHAYSLLGADRTDGDAGQANDQHQEQPKARRRGRFAGGEAGHRQRSNRKAEDGQTAAQALSERSGDLAWAGVCGRDGCLLVRACQNLRAFLGFYGERTSTVVM